MAADQSLPKTEGDTRGDKLNDGKFDGSANTPTINIRFFSDPICPWCWVGLKHLEQAMLEKPSMNFHISWQPFMLNPHMPEDGMDRRQYLDQKFGGREPADRFYAMIKAAGQKAGIHFNFDAIKRTPSTNHVHCLIQYLQNRQPNSIYAFYKQLFQAYFIEGQDIGDKDLLINMMQDYGISAEECHSVMNSGPFQLEIFRVYQAGKSGGITAVPFFIIGKSGVLSGAQPKKSFLPFFDMEYHELKQLENHRH